MTFASAQCRLAKRLLGQLLQVRFPNSDLAMVARRQIVLSSGAVAVGPLAVQGCSSASGDVSYEEAVQMTWRNDERAVSDSSLLLRELVRYATLAPSSHNTQCWKFRLEEEDRKRKRPTWWGWAFDFVGPWR